VLRRQRVGSHCHEASQHRVRKVKALACRFILRSFVSNFGSQREHGNEVYQTQLCEQVTVKFVGNARKVTKW
jgi:hypothetical protein